MACSYGPTCPGVIQEKLLLEKEVLGDLGQPYCEVTLEVAFKVLFFFIRTVEGSRWGAGRSDVRWESG